jgi:HK97 family phage prohead protease
MDTKRIQSRAADGMVRCSFSATSVRIDENGTPYLDLIISTSAIDRAGEMVVQDWDLEGVESVPFLWEHNAAAGFFGSYDPEHTLPIGRVTMLRLEDGVLKGRAYFVDEKANPLAPKVLESYRQGSLKSVSAGFIPHDVRIEKHDDIEVLVLSQNELLETSACVIPMNAQAGIDAASAKTFAALRERATKQETTMATKRTKSDATQADPSKKNADDVPRTQPDGDANETPKSGAEPMGCADCKAISPAGSKFCSQCGKAFPPPKEPDGDEGAGVGEGDDDGDEAEAEKSILALTGQKSLRAAVGVLVGWKHVATEETPKLRAEVETVRASVRAAEVDSTIEKLKAAKRWTPATEKDLRNVAEFSIESFRLAAKAVASSLEIPAFAPPTKEPETVTSAGNLTWKGKTYDQLAPMEKHELATNDPQLFAAMSAATKKG